MIDTWSRSLALTSGMVSRQREVAIVAAEQQAVQNLLFALM